MFVRTSVIGWLDMYWVQPTPSTHTPPEGTIKTIPTKYPQEFKERAVQLVGDRLNHPDAPSITAAIKDIAPRLGISHNTLARWCNNAALDTGKEITTTSDGRPKSDA
ncbi:transposase [Rothia nasimurium]|uniref:transposase n=1 Tax=Rothia nasimurium TaxID=85336 RepID=UPI001F45B639|nr:transposase [Rothia nasimurium]